MSDKDDGMGSWRARCNRYFTSLADSDADGDKEVKGDKSYTKNNAQTDENETWKSLSELRKVGNGKRNYIKRMLSVLDIHGAKICGFSNKVFENIVWLVIIVGSISVLVYLVHLQVKQYNTQTRTFETTNIETASQNTDSPMVSFCNRNILKKSSLGGTRFSVLLDIDVDKISNVTIAGINYHDTIKNTIESNKKLLALISRNESSLQEAVITELEGDVMAQALTQTPKLSALQYLTLRGRYDQVLDYLKPSLAELQVHGHKIEDMIVKCTLDGRECRNNELLQVTHKDFGNCLTVKPTGTRRTEELEVLLNVESYEYLSVASPSVGVNVIVHRNNLTSASSTEIRSSKYSVSPNNQLDIDVLQETVLTRMADGCKSGNSYTKEAYLAACIEDVIREVCGCQSLSQEDNQGLPVCSSDIFTEYICVRAIKELQKLGKLSCSCPEKCSETSYIGRMSILNWPSEHQMKLLQSQMTNEGFYTDSSYIRDNLVKVSVTLQPNVFYVVKEKENRTLLDVLAMVGGISALLVGVSLMTIVELLWVAAKMIWHFALQTRKRNEVRKVQRLSDSEITSITWAMHRLRRREEEIRKQHEAKNHKKNVKNEPNVFTGNVQSHIARRNNYLAPVIESQEDACPKLKESTYENPNKHPEIQKDAFQGQRRLYHDTAYRYGYESVEVPRYSQTPVPRLMRISHKPPDISEMSRHNMMHLEGIHRPACQQIYYEQVAYPHIGRLVTPADAIQLYGGQSAYFHSKQMSEPIYI